MNIFGVFRVKNHDLTPKKNHIFSNFRGGGGGGRQVRPPLDPPLDCTTTTWPSWVSMAHDKTTNTLVTTLVSKTFLFSVHKS